MPGTDRIRRERRVGMQYVDADAVSRRRGEAADARVPWERTGSQISRRMTEKGQREKMEGGGKLEMEGRARGVGRLARVHLWLGPTGAKGCSGCGGIGRGGWGPGWTDGRVHTEHGEGVARGDGRLRMA